MKEEDIMAIPEKFYKVDDPRYPVIVFTVGDLKEALKELPDDLPVNQEYSDDGGAIVTVFNMSKDGSYENAHLEFHEFEEDDLEEEE